MKKIIVFLMCVSLLSTLLAIPAVAEQPISVYVNGEKLEFDVEPIIMNGRTLVPMRKIFETLGATVSWNGDTETASGVRGGVRVSVSIDNPKAFIDGKATTLDQPPVLLDGRTLVPLRFIAEAYGAKVEWIGETQTVNITTDNLATVADAYYIAASDFTNLGSWSLNEDYLFGTHGSPDGQEGSVPGTDSATIELSIKKDGTYKVWTLARDYAANSPGSRYYNVSVDGVMVPEKMGTHGHEGFFWQEVGTYRFNAGMHTLSVHDTSGYYARCKALFVTSELETEPSDDIETLSKFYAPSAAATYSMPDNQFPYWATQPMQETETISLENDTFKINFIKGVGKKGNLVQNEIFVKIDGQWVKVKDKLEEFGYLMMAADKTQKAVPRAAGKSIGHHDEGENFAQTLVYNGEETLFTTKNYFESGVGYWFLPDDIQKISDNEVNLLFPAKDCATISVTVSMDDLVKEPKFKLDASFNKDGAYSFLLFSGDALDESKVSRSVVPFMNARKSVPGTTNVISEPFLFTPMVAFAVNADEGELVQGIAVDPSVTYQDVAYWETARYGYMLRDKENGVRAQITAPLMGTPGANFKAGDTYSFAYRVLAGTDGWYDTFKHVSEDLYNVKDIRTNYYGTLNDAVYNIDDLVMDDKYGAWDDNSMGFYYAEYDHQVAQCNPLQLVQRYLMSEDEAFLDERVAPTIAFMLSRKNNHFNYDLNDTSVLGSNELTTTPAIGGAAQWSTLYEMSQGRMPYALQIAINKGAYDIPAQAKFYNMTQNEKYLTDIKNKADGLVAKLDDITYNDGPTTDAFVLTDYNTYIPPLMYAYQVTGEQKYLDAAQEFSQGLMTALSSMGYQNGYADNMYHVDPQIVADAHVINADNSPWWWYGDFQWRRENEYGTWKPAAGTPSFVDEDNAPGWTMATVGLTTEHTFTAGHSNFILMNTWAPFMYKMAEWTGDDFFKTQSRNAIVGRFTNYPGYYVERYYTNYMKPEYPYEGPEYNILYFTHVAPFQAMVEDFQIQEVLSRSGGNIEFPEMWVDGYSYFTSNQYGAKPGKMYEEEGMWLNNTRDVVNTSDVNINYVAAKKDSVFGVALVNESPNAVSSDITLGGEIAGFNGVVTLYDKDGNKTETTATNGVFTVNIPTKGIVTAMVKSDLVKKPRYALDKILYNPTLEKTQTSHTNGKGYVIQFNPDKYHAYVYVTDKDIKSLTVEYEVNGEKKKVTDNKYPFEALVKVDSGSAEFKYNLTVTKADGSTTSYGNGILAPLSNGPSIDNIKDTIYNVVFEQDDSDVPAMSSKISKNYKQKISVDGIGGSSGKLRVVTKSESIGIPLEENLLGGLYARGTLTHKTSGRAFNFNVRALGNEGTNGRVVVLIQRPVQLRDESVDDFKMSNFELSAKPFTDELPKVDKEVGAINTTNNEGKTDNVIKDFKDGEYKVNFIGGSKNNPLRIAISYEALGFTPAENSLKGLYIRGVLKGKSGNGSVSFSGTILGNDVRENYCVMPISFMLPDSPESYELDEIEISTTPFTGQQVVVDDAKELVKEETTVPDTFEPFKVTAQNTGANAQSFRVVVTLDQFPFTVKGGTLKDYPAYVKAVDKEGNVVEGEFIITNSEERADGNAITITFPVDTFASKLNIKEFCKTELTISPKH